MRFDGFVKAWRSIQATGSATVGNLFATLFGGVFYSAATGGIITAITQAATVAIDASLGNDFFLDLTTNVAFILGNPTNPPPTGQEQTIRITISNTSGVAHGAGTFAALYKTSGNIPAIATGFSRTFVYRWNGTNWVELFQTAADVAN